MKNKRIISLVLIVALLFSVGVSAFALVGQSQSFYSADYANVLSNDTEQLIIDSNAALESQCQGAQLVVVTVDYLDGMYCDDYAYSLFNDWGVGSGDYNNGMLLLLAVQEGKAWLAYGAGLSNKLSTDDVDNMLEKYFWKDFDNAKYDNAVTKLFKALLKWYEKLYGVSLSVQNDTGSDNGSTVGTDTYRKEENNMRSSGFLGTLIFLIVLFLILSAIFGSRKRSRRRNSSNNSWLPWFLLFNSRSRTARAPRPPRPPRQPMPPRPPRATRPPQDRNRPPRGGGFGGGFGGGSGHSGFGGGMGRGGGGFSGGGGGRR